MYDKVPINAVSRHSDSQPQCQDNHFAWVHVHLGTRHWNCVCYIHSCDYFIIKEAYCGRFTALILMQFEGCLQQLNDRSYILTYIVQQQPRFVWMFR